MMLRTALIALAAAGCLAGGGSVAAEAGSVLFAAGDVTALRQPPVPLAKGDAVLDDDTVATGEASRAQILLTDGTKIALRPLTRLRIDEYAFAGATDSSGRVVTTSGDRSVATLLKGGFRTITGAIGKDDESAYEVRTPVGVLGIRGTDYAAVLCTGDCDWAPGVDPAAPIEDGLYLGVTVGAIFFRNDIADIDLQAGQYAFIPLVDPTPVRLDAPPPVLLDANDLIAAEPAPADGVRTGFDAALGTRRMPEAPGSAAPDGEGRPGGAEAPEQPVIAIDPDGRPIDITPGETPRPTGNRTIGYATGPLGGADAVWSGTLDNGAGEYVQNGNYELLGFTGTYPGAAGPTTAGLGIDRAGNVESGFDAVTVLRWGRWSGGSASADPGTGLVDAIDLGNQSLHWISGPEFATPPVLPITGTAGYSLVGATSPTDNFGNTGALLDASFFADFTNMTVDSTLSVDINATSWLATGTGSIGAQAGLPAHLFSGNYSVIVGGSNTGTGVFSGFFSAPGNTSDPSFPGGAGLTFSLQDMSGTTSVSGAVAFGNP